MLSFFITTPPPICPALIPRIAKIPAHLQFCRVAVSVVHTLCNREDSECKHPSCYVISPYRYPRLTEIDINHPLFDTPTLHTPKPFLIDSVSYTILLL